MNPTNQILSFLFLAGICLSGCQSNGPASTATTESQPAAFDLESAKQIIAEKNKKFTAAHITGDTAFLNAIFSRDAKIFIPNAAVVTGSEAIAAGNLEYVQFGIQEFREVTTSLYGCENYLIDEGTYYLRYGPDNTSEDGKYINIWKMEDGDWKIFSNIWNTNTPADPLTLSQ
jgi:ketosteroid isomerase-like protein